MFLTESENPNREEGRFHTLRPPCSLRFARQEKRKERLEEETREHRRIAARRRTRDLLLERAKQRLLAAAATAADPAAPNDAAAYTGQPDEGGLGDKVSLVRGGRDGKVAADVVVPGDGTGMPLYAQETSAARHSKVCGRAYRVTHRVMTYHISYVIL